MNWLWDKIFPPLQHYKVWHHYYEFQGGKIVYMYLYPKCAHCQRDEYQRWPEFCDGIILK